MDVVDYFCWPLSKLLCHLVGGHILYKKAHFLSKERIRILSLWLPTPPVFSCLSASPQTLSFHVSMQRRVCGVALPCKGDEVQRSSDIRLILHLQSFSHFLLRHWQYYLSYVEPEKWELVRLFRKGTINSRLQGKGIEEKKHAVIMM